MIISRARYRIADPTLAAVNGDFGLEELMGANPPTRYPFNNRVSIHGLAGYARGKAGFEGDANFTAGSTPLNRNSFTESESGSRYGGGIELDVFSRVRDGNLRLAADHMIYLDKSGTEFEAKSVGLKLDF